MPSILQRSDYEDFLIHLYYFKRDQLHSNPLQACWRRAYRDFNRTLHGIASNQDAYARAEEALNQIFTSIQAMDAPTQSHFDKWHRSGCDRLAITYRKCGYKSLFVGHAQKWINMTFKYIYVLGEKRLPGFAHLYDLCHVPLDNILIDVLKKRYGFEPLSCAWSRLNDYDIYMDRQHWIRRHFQLAPLDVEFRLWMEPSANEVVE